MTERTGEESLYVEGDGVRIAVSAWGARGAPPVLFLHGQGQSRRGWADVAGTVAAAGYRAIAVDLRGHGDSGWAPDGAYGFADYARDIARIIDRFAQPVTLMGWSRGGQVALVAAAMRQDKVRLTLLGDVAPQMRDEDQVEIIAYFDRAAAGFGSVEEAASLLTKHFARQGAIPLDTRRRAMTVRDSRYYWKWDPRTVAPEHMIPSGLIAVSTEAARVYRKPIVLMRAERHSLVTDEALADFKRLTPQLVVDTAAGATHILNWRDKKMVAERLLHHLRATAAV
jgi:pimeloyl-ACP methyl ester carboxylesterase